MFCGDCGKSIDENLNFCPYCGGKVDDAVYVATKNSEVKPGKKYNLITAYIAMFKNFMRFEGKSKKSEFWLAALANLIIYTVLFLMFDLAVDSVFDETFPLAGNLLLLALKLYGLAIFIPLLALTVRRLRDAGKSVWYIFVFWVPFLGQIAMILLMAENSRIEDAPVCPYCENRLSRMHSFCGICGVSKTHINEATSERTSLSESDGKKKRAVTTVAVSIFLIAVAALIIITHPKVAPSDDSKEKAESIEYKAGYVTENRYVSEYFGLEFEFGENWYWYTEEELETMTAESREKNIRTGKNQLRSQGSTQQELDAWADSFYLETEIGAYYVQDDRIVGLIYVEAMDCYGEITDNYSAQILDIMRRQELVGGGTFATGMKNIDGQAYDSLKIVRSSENEVIIQEYFCRVVGNKLCKITYIALEGYEQIPQSVIQCSDVLMFPDFQK